MDMSIGMKVPSGAICTLSLSFNNDGPLGTFFPLHLRQRHLHRPLRRAGGRQEQPIDVSQVDVSMNGIELQDREFFAAIRDGREAQSPAWRRRCLPCARSPPLQEMLDAASVG
jgi:2-hydroxy-4-carboxymuconate semialdehyde hemiacetal dehydrogenase